MDIEYLRNLDFWRLMVSSEISLLIHVVPDRIFLLNNCLCPDNYFLFN